MIRGVFWLSSHVDPEIADSYTKLLLNVPATAMVKFNESSLDEESKKSVLRRVWLARRTLLSKPQKFKTEQFSAVMDLLLNGNDNGLFEMLERGVWWSGRETRGNLAATTQEIVDTKIKLNFKIASFSLEKVKLSIKMILTAPLFLGSLGRGSILCRKSP